ncbi:MAG: 16S rRNA (uracil(1498)-N(3))-methyltransferase [Sphaerochaetaceae bacterium]|nr:16S rRNA (uracil(1498)-N(3))-methyltransferase [Sphaerochaetaceae bacterium]
MNIILTEDVQRGLLDSSDRRCEHIIKVLKLNQGDTFRLGSIKTGASGTAQITAVDSLGVHYTFTETIPDARNYRPVTLIVAQVRPICMKRILREAASAGVRKIIATGATTAEKSYSQADIWKKGEYREILLDGTMQGGFTGVPEVICTPDVRLALKEIPNKNADCVLLDNVSPKGRMSDFIPMYDKAVLAVGPERGWTDYERSLFSDAGFSTLSLGDHILRTETACTAGVTLLLARMNLL